MSMNTKLMIPRIGTVIELTQNTTFKLSYAVTDNWEIIKKLRNNYCNQDLTVVFPAGTVLVFYTINGERHKMKIWETSIPELETRLKVKGYFVINSKQLNGIECIVKEW